MKLLCIYHGNCADGFGAAWVVRNKLGIEVDFHSGVYQTPPPDVTGRHVLIVDFSYKRSVLLEMAKSARTITILDHHKSAEEDLKEFTVPEDVMRASPWTFEDMVKTNDTPNNIRALFDMNRSGAMIAWNYFNPFEEPPMLIEHIQDRDLWKFKMEGTREIQANLFSYAYDFDVWDSLVNECESEQGFLRMRLEGRAIERKHHKDIAELLKVVGRRAIIAGISVPVANLPYTMSSDAGHLMAQNEPFAACYWETANSVIFSLRSSENGTDVSEIAKKFGGGGHKHAAGFSVPFGTWPA